MDQIVSLPVPTGLAEYVRQRSPHKPVADVLADIFRARIMDGEYLPGMRLIEAELTKLFGVSRGPVREAIRRLTAEGLIEAEKHKSPTVKGIDREQFLQMFQVRAILEAFSANLAAEKLHKRKADIAWAKDERKKWADGTYNHTIQDFVDANTRFHERLLEIADHYVLSAHVRQLAIPGYKNVFKPLLRAEEMAKSSSQHVAILDAVISADGSKAETLMRHHVTESGARISAKYSADLFNRRLQEMARLTE